MSVLRWQVKPRRPCTMCWSDGPSLKELVSSLNADQQRVYERVKSHLEHQVVHECGCCQCSDLKPLHLFVSGVGGTAKSFLIKTVRALASELWDGDTGHAACAVTAPTGLAAFNVGEVTIHRLLQLPIEHEGRAAGYWRLGKDALKVMRTSLSKLKLLIIDKVSMVSSLNLTYIHLCMDEIFARDQWFGGVNILFVGDILQLPPVNGAPVFERMCNKSITSKLGCMTSVNIWQDSVVYDELTINECQKKDQVFSSMLDEVRRGCPAQETVQALKERVLSTPVVDKFHELMSSGQSPLCLFPTRQSCHDFNSEMLTKLDSELKEIKCVDEVDETKGTFKWSKKATKAMEKLNRDCNMTGGLEAVLKVAVGARVMLRRNIDTRSGLVNGALGTVTAIRTHHVTVQFDGRRQPYQVERVKGRFLVLKNIYVQRKQFPLILAFAVTIPKCQGLSLDCAVMDLSKQVFCAGMAYVALSHVKEMQNLHLIAFDVEAINVSGKSLEELNRLRQTYRPDLPLYAVPPPEKKSVSQTRKRKMSGTVDKSLPSPKKQRKSRVDVKSAQPPPPNKVTASRQPRPQKQGEAAKVLPSKPTADKKRKLADVKSAQPPPTKVTPSRKPQPQKQGEAAKVLPSKPTAGKKRKLDCAEQLSKIKGNFVYVGPRKGIPHRLRYNPVSPDWQRQACQQLRLRFVSDTPTFPWLTLLVVRKYKGMGIVCFELYAMS